MNGWNTESAATSKVAGVKSNNNKFAINKTINIKLWKKRMQNGWLIKPMSGSWVIATCRHIHTIHIVFHSLRCHILSILSIQLLYFLFFFSLLIATVCKCKWFYNDCWYLKKHENESCASLCKIKIECRTWQRLDWCTSR